MPALPLDRGEISSVCYAAAVVALVAALLNYCLTQQSAEHGAVKPNGMSFSHSVITSHSLSIVPNNLTVFIPATVDFHHYYLDSHL
jgi:hypothetical protein